MKYLKLFESFEDGSEDAAGLKYQIGDTVYYEDISDDRRSGPYTITSANISESGEKLYGIRSGRKYASDIFEDELSDW